MKKPYKKPQIYVETFELLEHIASCSTGGETTITYRDGHSCTYTEANVTVFYPEDTRCTNGGYFDIEDDSMYDSFEDYLRSFGCYNAFSNGNFFAS